MIFHAKMHAFMRQSIISSPIKQRWVYFVSRNFVDLNPKVVQIAYPQHPNTKHNASLIQGSLNVHADLI